MLLSLPLPEYLFDIQLLELTTSLLEIIRRNRNALGYIFLLYKFTYPRQILFILISIHLEMQYNTFVES